MDALNAACTKGRGRNKGGRGRGGRGRGGRGRGAASARSDEVAEPACDGGGGQVGRGRGRARGGRGRGRACTSKACAPGSSAATKATADEPVVPVSAAKRKRAPKAAPKKASKRMKKGADGEHGDSDSEGHGVNPCDNVDAIVEASEKAADVKPPASGEKKALKTFRAECRASWQIPKFKYVAIVIYWTKNAVGLKFRQGKLQNQQALVSKSPAILGNPEPLRHGKFLITQALKVLYMGRKDAILKQNLQLALSCVHA